MRYFLALYMAVGSVMYGIAQNADWVQQMQDPTINFYTVQQNFNAFWHDKEIEKGKGYKQFRRWENFMEPRVYPEGIRPNPEALALEFEKLKAKQTESNSGQWQPVGPFNGDVLNGIGRVNRITFNPNNPQIVWMGTPAGGLWKSTDGGLNWTTNTDLLPNLGVSDIAIDPSNTNIMYLATGDRDGGDTYSYGILKSTDGGQTWNQTGLKLNQFQNNKVHSLYINPDSTNIIIAATSNGILRSTDAGQNWNFQQGGNFNSMVQKPGDPSTLYSSTISTGSSRIYRSTNNGITWSHISTGLPTSGVRRIEIAVTADDPDYVYAVYGASNNGFYGFYRSTNSGTSWTTMATSPNLLGWSTSGGDSGGQAWYDLAIAASPNDKDEVYVGGVNVWSSNNGGQNWNLAGHWYGGGGAPFIHADIHHLTYTPNGDDLYVGCDGGVYKRDDTFNDWTSLNDGINISQHYRISDAIKDTALILTGAQDNGTDLYNTGWWDGVLGGDGMDNAINPKNPNIMYGSSQYGNFSKSTNRGASFNASFNLSAAGSGNWVTPIALDPNYPDTLYIGFNRIYRSYNGGISFSQVGPNLGSGNFDRIVHAPRHSGVIYFTQNGNLWRSDDNANTFVGLTGTLPHSGSITHIAVSHKNPMHAAISYSGYSAGNKVFTTIDGGLSWKNISYNLPNIPANCLVFEEGSANGIYVGTDLGVFYIDDYQKEWVTFNQNLPNVIVNDLEINYNNRKLRAGTYGRGLWESPLYGDISAPKAVANIPEVVCSGAAITLRDSSVYNPQTWKWDIRPNTFSFINGSNANSQNPVIQFTQDGIYDISLTVSNNLGEDSTFILSAIAIKGYPLPFNEAFEAIDALEKWNISEPDYNTWSLYATTGATTGNQSVGVRLLNKPDNLEYDLITPTLSFENHNMVNLSFEYAYSGGFQDADDTLQVFISTDCSDNWILLETYYEDGSNNFRTANASFTEFTPNKAADWCVSSVDCKNIDLSTYANKTGVRIMFKVLSNGDNNLYLDNINISGNPTTAPTADFSSLNNYCALENITFTNHSYGSPTQYEWSFPGGIPSTSTLRNGVTSYPNPGTYDVHLKVSNAFGSDSIVKTQTVTIGSADSVNFSLNNGIGGTTQYYCKDGKLDLTATATNPGNNPIYTWYINNSLIQSGSSPDFEFSTLLNGAIVYATVESSEACAWPKIAYSDTMTIGIYADPSISINHPSRVCNTDAPIALTANPAGGTFSGVGVNSTSGTFDPSLVSTPHATITYTFTDTTGCIYTYNSTIAVDAPTPISFDPAQTEICNGSSTPLNLASPSGGTYSGEGVFNNTFYTDSVSSSTVMLYYSTDNSGCTTLTDSIAITILPEPTKPSITQQGASLVCNSTVAVSYQWLLNNVPLTTSNNSSYTPNVSGDYTVRITDANGCTNVSDVFNFAIGLEESSNATSFVLFPNPVKESFTLQLETFTAAHPSYSIFDAAGKHISTEDLPNDVSISHKVDVKSFPKGIYFLHINGDDLNIHRTFIVE